MAATPPPTAQGEIKTSTPMIIRDQRTVWIMKALQLAMATVKGTVHAKTVASRQLLSLRMGPPKKLSLRTGQLEPPHAHAVTAHGGS